MEEDILNLIKWGYKQNDIVSDPDIITAHEIAAYVTENYYDKNFVKWLQKWSHPFGRVENTDPLLYVNFNEGRKKQYTLEEVCQYWKENILKTQ